MWAVPDPLVKEFKELIKSGLAKSDPSIDRTKVVMVFNNLEQPMNKKDNPIPHNDKTLQKALHYNCHERDQAMKELVQHQLNSKMGRLHLRSHSWKLGKADRHWHNSG